MESSDAGTRHAFFYATASPPRSETHPSRPSQTHHNNVGDGCFALCVPECSGLDLCAHTHATCAEFNKMPLMCVSVCAHYYVHTCARFCVRCVRLCWRGMTDLSSTTHTLTRLYGMTLNMQPHACLFQIVLNLLSLARPTPDNFVLRARALCTHIHSGGQLIAIFLEHNI